jgi:uncharacterized protein DUF3551
MRINRRTRQSASALLACSTMFVMATSATAAGSGVPPYCVLKGGARGIPLPQICRFYDYQHCLQAAADLNGNCVVNIDYHGDVSTPPARAGARQRY